MLTHSSEVGHFLKDPRGVYYSQYTNIPNIGIWVYLVYMVYWYWLFSPALYRGNDQSIGLFIGLYVHTFVHWILSYLQCSKYLQRREYLQCRKYLQHRNYLKHSESAQYTNIPNIPNIPRHSLWPLLYCNGEIYQYTNLPNILSPPFGKNSQIIPYFL